MVKLSGVFSESFGATCVFRGFAKYKDIIETSYPHPDYQRPEDEQHIEDITNFILQGSNSFSPEVVLAYTPRYNYYDKGADSGVDAISDIRNGKGFTSNIDGISFKKIRSIENGYVYDMTIPEKTEPRPFRRIDGNHRLMAFERLITNEQVKSTYLIPFCIILFSEELSLKDEKIIFHNINSKAIPIKSEQLLKSLLNESGKATDFSDDELKKDFGFEYLVARNILKNRPLLVRNMKNVDWVKPEPCTTIVNLVEYVSTILKIESKEQAEAFEDGLSKALGHAKDIDSTKKLIPSGMLFLLTAMYYQIALETEPNCKAIQDKNNLLTWAEKYQVTELQTDTAVNAAANANCIRAIFEKYQSSTHQTIFMSRCFSNKYDENEHTIRRVIDEINKEKHSGLRLVRVDKSTDGATKQISDRVLADISSAGLVIADLSSGRPNIPHEIGYAMGLKKDLIIIHNGTDKQAEEHTPSNIKLFEQIRFDGSYQTLHDELKRRLVDYYKL